MKRRTAAFDPGHRRPGRWIGFLAVASLVVAVSGVVGISVAPPPARAECSGVTVVVDFGSAGGGTATGCASGDPGTGLAALQAAGFGYGFVPRQPGFICQINNAPNPCNGAPPNAYWSYWHGQPGESWSYSSGGAASHDPAPGTVEGWAFGAGSAPSIAPPARPAPNPPAPPPGGSEPGQPAPPGQPGPGDPQLPGNNPENPAPQNGGPAPNNPGQPAGEQPATPEAGIPEASAAAAGDSSAAAERTRGSSGSPRAVDATSSSGGGTLNWLAGAAVVGLLTAFAAWQLRRRRRATQQP